MKLLFLDIDGVLNSHQWYRKNTSIVLWSKRELNEINPTALFLLKDFVELYNIKIIISSSWRIIMTYIEIKDMFKRLGWEDAPIIGATPIFNSVGSIRGHEIDKFLKEFKTKVNQYVILDDSSDMTQKQKQKHFVQTDWAYGLQDKHINLLKEKFNETMDRK